MKICDKSKETKYLPVVIKIMTELGYLTKKKPSIFDVKYKNIYEVEVLVLRPH